MSLLSNYAPWKENHLQLRILGKMQRMSKKKDRLQAGKKKAHCTRELQSTLTWLVDGINQKMEKEDTVGDGQQPNHRGIT